MKSKRQPNLILGLLVIFVLGPLLFFFIAFPNWTRY
jgi:hypothetical protein